MSVNKDSTLINGKKSAIFKKNYSEINLNTLLHLFSVNSAFRFYKVIIGNTPEDIILKIKSYYTEEIEEIYTGYYDFLYYFIKIHFIEIRNNL